MTSSASPELIPLLTNLQEKTFDVDFSEVHRWKEAHPGKKAIATFPVYVPHELIYAFGHLPVNIYGGGEEISISHADAILGSFICSISKSTTELLLSHDPFNNAFDGYVFPFICDVARNLSGIFGRRTSKPVYMLHLAQNVHSNHSVPYLKNEFQRMVKTLFPDEDLDIEMLKKSIELYNENRELYRTIYAFRFAEPWKVPLDDLYLTMRIGSNIDVIQHNKLLKEKLAEYRKSSRVKKDAIRVVVTGNFCEQPPLDIIRLIEQVGCYVIDDDFMIGRRFYQTPVKTDQKDPLEALAEHYLSAGAKTATRFHQGEKGELILERVRNAKADGVIFLTAKFCEPALDDLVLQQQALQEEGIPSVHIEFEERGSGYENIRLSLETFVESLLFD